MKKKESLVSCVYFKNLVEHNQNVFYTLPQKSIGYVCSVEICMHFSIRLDLEHIFSNDIIFNAFSSKKVRFKNAVFMSSWKIDTIGLGDSFFGPLTKKRRVHGRGKKEEARGWGEKKEAECTKRTMRP